MFQIKSNGEVVKIVKEPYAIVFKDCFTLLRIGEKEEMEAEFELLMKKTIIL